MENERAIEIIKGEMMHCQIHLEDKNKAPEYYQEMNELCEAYEMAIKALENSRWIPTSEMLPDKYGCYLVMWRCLEGHWKDQLFYEICEYVPEEDEWERIEQAGKAGAEIVAWMPLPEPYTKEETT